MKISFQRNFQHWLKYTAIGNMLRFIFRNTIVLFVVAIIGYGLYYFFVFIPNHPQEPKTSGKFPSNLGWVFEADGTILTSPVTDGKYIFIRTIHSLYSIDTVSGKVVWKTESADIDSAFRTSALIFSPQINNPYLIAPETEKKINVYSLDTGIPIWEQGQPKYNNQEINAISVNNQSAFVGIYNGYLIAYNTGSGDYIWKQDICCRAFPYLTANDETLYLGLGHFIRAYDANTGRLIWEIDLQGIVGPLALDEQTLYVTIEKGSNVVAIDIRSHKILWKKSYYIEPYKLDCLTLFDENLYISANRLVSANKFNGEPNWVSENTERLECPTFHTDVLFVRNRKTSLYMLDKYTGKELGKLQVQANSIANGDFSRSPLVIGDLLIVPFGDNRVFAYWLK